VLLVHRGLSRRVRKIEGIFTALQKKADEIDARDPYTANHSKRVAFYSVLIATALGIGAKDIELLRTAARVHDIGKALVPPEVLLKEGRLNDEEWELLKRHPVEGYRMLAAYSAYERGKTLVLVHHERYDGRGYPSGISLRELQLLAQIIPVADSIDAMRSDRPYRRGLSDSRVAAILMEGRGRQWNPHVVDAAITALGLDAAVNAPVAA